MPPVVRLLAVVAALQDPGRGGNEVELRVARFYRPGDSTLVHAFIRIPSPLLRPVHRGPQGWAAYRVAVTVRDTAGQLRASRTWARSVPAADLVQTDRYVVEPTQFTLPPGRYVCAISVTDSATGRVAQSAVRVTAYPRQPMLSDVLLAAEARAARPRREPPPLSEVEIGTAVLRAPGWPPADRSTASLAYFAEVYRGGGDGAVDTHLTGWLEDSSGSERRRLPTPRIAGTPGSRYAVGRIAVTGLAAGRHRLVVVARGRGDTVARAVDLWIGPGARGAEVLRDAFATATLAQLDSLYAPLVYVMVQDELGIYATLPTGGRRDFLRTFWARRDPTPGTPENEAMTAFYERVALANRDFREGGAGSPPGWRTDRGRVLILHGLPDEMLRQPQPADALPYEVWKYMRGKPVKFVFVDLTRFGNYVMVWSNDVREVGRPNWRQLLGPRAVEEVMRF